ncbi:hypothetical protein [Pseudoduganella namucuonensis]|uniref:Uncharacterized protein n=1 Tax=Pseudoduganella namucuonensis TaxID=1035707 RepID=A0A1I7K8Y5_9BURK|nr:hypothetical protein [Pseudoduganella namucuonensis]SFU93913.1 hypothetical protein SAMN05216552_1015117 [Pseudoduganella namucuonensis]
MNDDDEDTAIPEPSPAWCNPHRAKDLLYGGAILVRDMLIHDHDALHEMYGLRPDEAAQALRFVELAELRSWGVDEMLEVVSTVPNQATNEAALRRRVVMAMKAETGADFIHPGDAVLLLERSGLMLSTELREAVTLMSIRFSGPEGFSLDDENRFRRLRGRLPFPVEDTSTTADEKCTSSAGGTAGTPVPAAPPPPVVHRTKSRVRLLDTEIKRAWEAVGSADHHAVWTALKEMALQSTSPFTGTIDPEKGLEYWKEDKLAYLSKDALRKRIPKDGASDNGR